MNKNKVENKGNLNNPIPLLEQEVLEFWDKAKTFEKSVENPPNPLLNGGNNDNPPSPYLRRQAFAKEGFVKDYVFYDGPPFGTGEPHYGHLLSSIAKDVVPRYWTMKGFRVERRWGWDCHGLPIENIIEKDLGISGKKEIEKLGIAKFNEACRARVLEFADIWDVMIRRIGRWVDFKNSYKTMDPTFMESVWWAFKQLWNKDLIYEGRKVLLYCPRCETPVSNFEVAMDNSYKDIKETSVYVKFKVKSKKLKVKNIELPKNTFILAWTTTPWTLPGNVALAISSEIKYALLKIEDDFYIVAKDRLDVINKEYKIVQEFKGEDLVGLEYEPLFDLPALKNSDKKVYYIADADFVTTEDGTGVVHTAVVYGEDDYNLGIKLDLPVVPALDEKGFFNKTVPQFKGIYFKEADKLIIADLDKRKLLFATEDITHAYPHCWRCETQLFYNALPALFLAISKLKKRMLALNKNINWFPAHLKYGRFALGIEQAPDWNISRNRYFATPIPVWKCDQCENKMVVSSIKELEKLSDKKDIKDIHSHFIDNVTWSCNKCEGTMRRVKEVFDCWVESGSMSFAQMHYPFENKEKFEKNFPAQYISEYISQTRAWFYVMHVLSTALFDSNCFENVVATGVILNEKGEKMSKSKKNFPDPSRVIDQYGADALRFYLMNSSLMQAENLFFNETELRDIFRKNIIILWNVFKFYELYAATSQPHPNPLPLKERETSNILDRWIMTRLNQLIEEVTKNMDGYNIPKATRPIVDFINDLSTWYIRRSRDRFKSESKNDKEAALQTTGFVLTELSKVIAPFMPFLAEQIWQKVTGFNFGDENKSVHLEAWPSFAKASEGKPGVIIENMGIVRKIVELGLAKRDKAGIKVRQPIVALKIKMQKTKIKIDEDYLKLIKDEVNAKNIDFIGEGELAVELDTTMTEELKLEGIKRELVRTINGLRKEAGLTIIDKIELSWGSESEELKKVFWVFRNEILKDTLAQEIKEGETRDSREFKINGQLILLSVRKI